MTILIPWICDNFLHLRLVHILHLSSIAAWSESNRLSHQPDSRYVDILIMDISALWHSPGARYRQSPVTSPLGDLLMGSTHIKRFSPHSPERQSGEILIEIHLVYQFPNILSRIFILGCLVCSVHTCCLLPYYLHRTPAPSEHFTIISYHSG